MRRCPGAQITLEELNVIARLPHYCPVCAYKEWGLEELVHMCWEYLDLIRTYTKPKAGPLVVNLSLPNLPTDGAGRLHTWEGIAS